jgi:hypothetical protein
LQHSDTSHLLNDPYPPNYGTHSAHNAPAPDPEELRRQREALERICAETSEWVVAPRTYLSRWSRTWPLTCSQLIPVSQPNAISPEVEQSANEAEYARLFNERFATMRKPASRPASADVDADDNETAWLEQALGGQGEDEVDQIEPTKGGLTIQFGAR